MKTSSSVRRPTLVNSGKRGDNSVKPVGEILRDAKRDLVFRRLLVAIFLVLLITGIVALFSLGYVNQLVDYFLALAE
ncbi:MAG: hypothetical protein MJ166_01030 [Clostridia bacterium]|nr:hypothetical protein [Clostridia bacterium]